MLPHLRGRKSTTDEWLQTFSAILVFENDGCVLFAQRLSEDHPCIVIGSSHLQGWGQSLQQYWLVTVVARVEIRLA